MKLIAFDLDDTLYKERDFVDSGYRFIARHLAGKYGFDHDEMYRAMANAPLNPFDSLQEYLINRAVQHSLTVDEDIPWMVRAYRSHLPEITFSDGTYETFSQLIARGYRLALITDGRVTTQSNKIASLGVDNLIQQSNISISEAVGAEKFNPLPFERMMAINRDCDSFAYVGDNPMKDFVWPNRLGWLTIQLRDNGRNVHSQSVALPSPDYAPRIVVDSLPEILDIFK